MTSAVEGDGGAQAEAVEVTKDEVARLEVEAARVAAAEAKAEAKRVVAAAEHSKAEAKAEAAKAKKAAAAALKVANVAAGALATLAKDNTINQLMITEEVHDHGLPPLLPDPLLPYPTPLMLMLTGTRPAEARGGGAHDRGFAVHACMAWVWHT